MSIKPRWMLTQPNPSVVMSTPPPPLTKFQVDSLKRTMLEHFPKLVPTPAYYKERDLGLSEAHIKEWTRGVLHCHIWETRSGMARVEAYLRGDALEMVH